MSKAATHQEILALEERLKQAELGPDPEFFQEHLDENMILVMDQKAVSPKKFIVDAHRPEKGNKFTQVEMSDMNIVDHGSTAVVTCTGTYEGAGGKHQLKFMRVWAKKPEGWRIVAGANYS